MKSQSSSASTQSTHNTSESDSSWHQIIDTIENIDKSVNGQLSNNNNDTEDHSLKTTSNFDINAEIGTYSCNDPRDFECVAQRMCNKCGNYFDCNDSDNAFCSFCDLFDHVAVPQVCSRLLLSVVCCQLTCIALIKTPTIVQ